jgi:Ca-activated chloride channel family protein
MKRVLVAAAVWALALAAPTSGQQAPTFRSSVQTVPLYATVVAKADGRLVADLEEKDFQIYDNGKLQTITNFEKAIQPVTVMVTLDTSGSMTMSLGLLKDAAEAFVIRLLPEDKARLMNFDDKITLSPRFTSSRDDLIRYIHEDIQYGNATRLWDAVDASMTALTPIKERKVILLFTDGDDSGSRQAGLDDVIKRAQTEEVMIYSIGLRSHILGTITNPDKGIKRLAEETGGGYFLLTSAADLNATFTRVAEELHRQYVLGFTPQTLDGKLHKLELKVTQANMVARARTSYMATKR